MAINNNKNTSFLFPHTNSTVLPDPSKFFSPNLLSTPLPTNSFFQNFVLKNGDQLIKSSNSSLYVSYPNRSSNSKAMFQVFKPDLTITSLKKEKEFYALAGRDAWPMRANRLLYELYIRHGGDLRTIHTIMSIEYPGIRFAAVTARIIEDHNKSVEHDIPAPWVTFNEIYHVQEEPLVASNSFLCGTGQPSIEVRSCRSFRDLGYGEAADAAEMDWDLSDEVAMEPEGGCGSVGAREINVLDDDFFHLFEDLGL